MFKNKNIISLIEKKKETYSSFPTVVFNNNKITMFYREGVKKSTHPHGFYGVVKTCQYDFEEFLTFFNGKKTIKSEINTIFSGDNELDSIVSKLDENIFSLATRIYIQGLPMKTYLSFSDSPNFKDRMEIKVKGTQWVIFYGKAFKTDLGYIFPAYGPLTKDTKSRPLVLITDDFKNFEILSVIESNIFMNESSISFDGENYHIFSRENENQFGIWHHTSNNLQNWKNPEKLFSLAHAPMSFNYKDGIYLSYRNILEKDKAAISVYNLKNKESKDIETYFGNIYDGGYTDPVIINNKVFVFYYFGNKSGEPEIKCALLY